MSLLSRLAASRLLTRGQKRLEAGRPDEACAALERALALEPRSSGTRIHLALASARAGHPERGLAVLDAGAADFAEPALRALFRGMLLVELGRLAEAEAALAEAARAAPENLLVPPWRELVRIETGLVREGVEALVRIGLPESFSFQRRLALALEQRLFPPPPPPETPAPAAESGGPA